MPRNGFSSGKNVFEGRPTTASSKGAGMEQRLGVVLEANGRQPRAIFVGDLLSADRQIRPAPGAFQAALGGLFEHAQAQGSSHACAWPKNPRQSVEPTAPAAIGGSWAGEPQVLSS
jgi:hypothetical protein